MNISFDKFFDFLKQWSAARLAVLVLLTGELWVKLKNDTHFIEPALMFKLISMAILLEVFDITFTKLKSDKRMFWIYLISTIVSLGGIVIIAFSIFFDFNY